jgi:cation transport ATPase
MRVIAGSINGQGALQVEIDKTGGETYLAQVIEMVHAAQASRSRTQDLANRAAPRWFKTSFGRPAITPLRSRLPRESQLPSACCFRRRWGLR